MKKQLYISPVTQSLTLEAATMLSVSGGTSNYGNEPGEDNVEFDARRGSWNDGAFDDIDD